MSWRLELRSFLSSSTIHGLPYLTSNGEGGLFRRLFWSLVVLTAFALAAVLIRKTLAEGARNPIMTYTEIVPVQVRNTSYTVVWFRTNFWWPITQ